MVRYDESNEEHSKFLIQTDNNEPDAKKKKKTKEKKERKSTESNSIGKPVSKEKFYEVSSSIKEAFESGKSGFSLLQSFGRSDSDNKNDDDFKSDKDQSNKSRKNYVSSLNNVDDDKDSSSDENISDVEEKDNTSVKSETEIDKISVNSLESKKLLIKTGDVKKDVNARGVWKEPCFFQMDDPRFKGWLLFFLIDVFQNSDVLSQDSRFSL